MKYILAQIFILFFIPSFCQNIKDSASKEVNATLGVGFPYGGIVGTGLEFNPFSNRRGIFITSSIGYAFWKGNDLGYSVGVKYLLSRLKSTSLIKS